MEKPTASREGVAAGRKARAAETANKKPAVPVIRPEGGTSLRQRARRMGSLKLVWEGLAVRNWKARASKRKDPGQAVQATPGRDRWRISGFSGAMAGGLCAALLVGIFVVGRMSSPKATQAAPAEYAPAAAVAQPAYRAQRDRAKPVSDHMKMETQTDPWAALFKEKDSGR